MKRIGITVNIQDNIFSNGVNQNAIFLAKVLKKCGYIVDLICADEKTISEVNRFKVDVNVFSLEKSYKIRYNLIIQLGHSIEKKMSSNWIRQNPNVKFVAYECGNHYLINTEKMLFHKSVETNYFRGKDEFDQKPHQVWSIPQMENTNSFFYQFKNRQEKVTVVPFIWDSLITEESFLRNGVTCYEVRNIERCSVMEPNVSVMKNVILPVVILEKNQKINPLKEVYLFGAVVLKESKPFIDFIKSTELSKKGIISVENRFSTAKILTKHVDFVFSWQWENNLNYLWLDCAWMGYPIIHNGSMCQDVGYYYEGFDGDGAIEKIREVINTHNQNHEEYFIRNREIIKRYTSENQKLIDQYRELVEDVLNNKFSKRTYDWKENSVKKYQ